ncbi:MAG: InlB B-repeat-containing protein, partial [Clostridia bacterium]|nr:InlB B-repeat-containing protein [Clostridia bacterium]
PVYWQVTYRTKDYLTIMMTRPYTVEYFNYDGKTYSSGIFAGTTKTDYDQYGNYSRSTLRQATQQIYTDMNSTNSVLSQIVISPSAMESATGTNWQYSSTQQPDAKYSSSACSHHNALYSYSGSYYSSWTWDNTVYSDMFWIPSFYELYNTSTSSNSFNGGLWGLSSQSYAGFETASFLNSGVTTSYCWLRSGGSVNNDLALRVNSSGASNGYYVHYTFGVRPAAHLSLSSIASLASKTVTFNSNGGSECEILEVSPNTAYSTLPTPTRTGYTFAGWYKNSDLTGSAVSSTTTVTADHTLYAKWTPNTYYIEYNGNGATNGSMSNSTHTYDTAKALITNTYTRTGYSFLGWSTSSTATTATYTNGQSVNNLTSTNGGLIVLYAVWQANPYTITIQASSGGSVSSTGGKYASGDIITSFAAPNVGKAFLYWVRASDNAQILENPLNQTVTKNETYTAIFGASVEGVAVASTVGGIAYLIADYYDNLSDTDTITFVTKQVLQGYTFSHWEDMDGNNLGSAMSIKLTKAQVMDNIITAVYVQISNANVNEDVSN